MSEYDDIKTLQDTGCWPNKVVPEWAEQLAKKYGDCAPTSSSVLITGLQQEVRRLRKQVKEVNTLKGPLLNSPSIERECTQ